MTALAIVLITLALVFYTIGVWAERLQRTLKPWHVVMFVIGLICDSSGTFVMGRIQDAGQSTQAGPLTDLMMITGLIALILMLIHAVWAVVVLVRNREHEKATFHKFSIIVWAIWLVPYITGAMGGMIEG